MAPITRRKFLLGGMAVLMAAPFANYVSAPLSHPQAWLRHIPPEWLDTELGKQYIKTVLQGVTAEEILMRLQAKLPWYARSNGFLLRFSLRQSVQSDYRYGRIHDVDGWLLPETAVYLCGLAAMQDSDLHVH